jgi:hypothetical protein
VSANAGACSNATQASVCVNRRRNSIIHHVVRTVAPDYKYAVPGGHSCGLSRTNVPDWTVVQAVA